MKPLPKTKQGNQFLVVMMDGYEKLTNTISTTKSNSTTVAGIFLEYWVANYRISSTLPIDNRHRFASQLYVAVRRTLVMKNITTTEHHTQTNVQAKRLYSTLTLQLRVYVCK